MIPVCVSRIRLRLDSESGRKMGHVGSQVGSGSGYRRRAWGIEGRFQVERIERGCQEGRKRFGGRDRDGEGESGRIHDNILIVRILIDDIPGRHGVVVRVRLREVMHAALQVAGGRWAERVHAEGSLVVIGQVLDANLCSSTFLLGMNMCLEKNCEHLCVKCDIKKRFRDSHILVYQCTPMYIL